MNIREFLETPFPLLDSIRHRWILILSSLVFGILFVNLFVPFNINQWSKDSGLEEFLRLSGFGMIAGLVLLVSQIGLRKLFGPDHFRVWTFLVWFIGELSLMAILFIVYQSNNNMNIRLFLKDIPDSFKYTLLGIVIPYSLVLLVLALIFQKTKIVLLQEKIEEPLPDKPVLIDLADEKGTIRFSVSAGQLLYFEAADNYVFVYYMNGNKPEKQILRNSMKKIEKQLDGTSFKRCHRSFLVNLQKVEVVDYGQSKCRIKLSGLEQWLPVSRNFYPGFRSFANPS